MTRRDAGRRASQLIAATGLLLMVAAAVLLATLPSTRHQSCTRTACHHTVETR